MISHKFPFLNMYHVIYNVHVHAHVYMHAVSNWEPTHMQEYPRIQAVESVRGECH